MDNTQYIVAIEIGSSKTVGAVAEISPDGKLRILAVVTEHTINCVRYGCIQNVESTKSSVNRIVEKLNDYVEGDIQSFYVSIAGRTLHTMPTDVRARLPKEQAITNEIIDNIIEKAIKDKYASYDTIDAVAKGFTVDGRDVKNPVGTFGTEIMAHLNMILASSLLATNIRRAFTPTQLKGIITLPTALADAVLTDDERELGCMLLDLGAETTTVSIYRGGTLEYLNTLPLGGRNLTLDIKAFGIREEAAEKIKKNLAEPLNPSAEVVTIDGIRSRDASNYIYARTGEIIANINNQATLANVRFSELHSIVITGGGALLKGIDKMIGDSTGLPVRIASNIPQGIIIRTAAESQIDYIGVYALLLTAAKVIGIDSCVSKPIVYKPQPEAPAAPVIVTHEDNRSAKKRPAKGAKDGDSFWERMKSKVVKTLTENDDNDDNDDHYN